MLIELFAGLVVMLAYMDASLTNIFGEFFATLVSEVLFQNGGNNGFMFITLYAAPWTIGWLG